MTMTVSTYIISYNHAIYARLQPWFERFQTDRTVDEEVREYGDHAVAIGYDEVTERALPLLEERYGEVVVIDRKTEHIAELAEEDRYDRVFGDFRHSEVRKAAGLKRAKFVLSSTVELDVNEVLLDEVREDAIVFTEAERIADAYRLYERGTAYVIMGTYLAAEKFSAHLRLYFTDPEAFEEAIEADIEQIRRKDRRLAEQERPAFDLDVDPRRLGGDD